MKHKETIKVGFDLGNTSLKIAAVRKGGLALYELPLPENLMDEDTVTMPHAFSAFLKKAKKDLRLPAGPAGLILPASQVICRQVTMPRMTVDQLLLNLPYELSDFIRGEPHQYYCDYALCQDPVRPEAPPADGEEEEELPQEMTMMAAAVEKQQVSAYVRMFAGGGFPLRLMLPQEMTLLQLAGADQRPAHERPEEYCFIDLGSLSTRIFVIQGDRLQATRRIPVGCRELDQVVADVLNVDPFLTDAYKRGNHRDILTHPRCMEVYENIAVEALKLINFYHFTYRQNQLTGVYLIGGGAGIAPLCQVLEQTLGLPALPVDRLLPATEENGDLAATCAAAVGLVLPREEERP